MGTVRIDCMLGALGVAKVSEDLECLLSVSLGIGCYINQSFLADGLTGASEGFSHACVQHTKSPQSVPCYVVFPLLYWHSERST
eukprot:5787613-Amphidinium_carterae.1